VIIFDVSNARKIAQMRMVFFEELHTIPPHCITTR